MRSLVASALALVVAVAAAAGQDSTKRAPTTAERELFRLEDRWAAALIARDAGFFRRTLHRDYVYSDERGVFNKTQVIAEQTASSDTVLVASNEGMRAQVYGYAAVVTGILAVRGRGKDGAFEHRYRYTDTWIRSGGRWLMVASQDYDMPQR